MTSIEVRLNLTVSFAGISSTGRPSLCTFVPGAHMLPSSVTSVWPVEEFVTAYCGYWNSQLHWNPVTFTTTSGRGDSLSTKFSSLAVK